MNPASSRRHVLSLTTWATADTLEFVSTHDRDWTVTEQPNATHRRINEAGHSAPSIQHSVTRGVQNLRISDYLAAPAAMPAPPPSTKRNSRRPPQPKQQPREYLCCAQCGPDPTAHKASTDGRLMQHMEQKHGGQLLLPASVGQLRRPDRAACVVCSTIRSQRCNRCGLCNSNTPLRELLIQYIFQDRRQPGHRNAALGGAAADQQPPQSS